MQEISLSGYSINGTVPASLGNLTRLNGLFWEGNMLTGTMPEEICNLTLVNWIVDCKGDNPAVECSYCTECAQEI